MCVSCLRGRCPSRPEILVLDEVLAVGDADFQKKCLAKMDEASKREGRTILFVSHSLAAISELTSRAILLEALGGL
jgi:lipopolysaccharide transport system ATP-binding protein